MDRGRERAKEVDRGRRGEKGRWTEVVKENKGGGPRS